MYKAKPMARCELCLERDGWTSPTDNLMLVLMRGRERLVCRRDNPNRRSRSKYEPEID